MKMLTDEIGLFKEIRGAVGDGDGDGKSFVEEPLQLIGKVTRLIRRYTDISTREQEMSTKSLEFTNRNIL